MNRAFYFLLTAVVAHTAVAGLNLTPLTEEYTSQGFVYRKVTFEDGDRFVTYVPPQGWEVRGSGGRVSFVPHGKQFLEASVLALPMKEPQPFDEAALNLLREAVLRDAPAGSTMAKLVSEQENSVAMGAYPNHEFVIAYQSLGRVFQRSVIYVNAPETRLVFQFSAPKAEFDQLSATFRGSLNSWHWTERKPAVAESSKATAAAAQ